MKSKSLSRYCRQYRRGGLGVKAQRLHLGKDGIIGLMLVEDLRHDLRDSQILAAT